MSQQVRLAPASLDAVYVKGGYVTLQRAGVDLPVAPGHHPAWQDVSSIAFCPPEDGTVQVYNDLTGVHSVSTLPAGNTLCANAGEIAVHRTDPRRVETTWAWTLAGETDPVLSADGHWLATLVPDLPPGLATLRLRDTHDHDSLAWNLRVGAITRPRFSHVGTTLVWEDAGHVWGIRDVANTTSQVVRLSRDGDPWYHPVPLWCPEREELFLLVVQPRGGDTGVLVLAEWNSCVTQAPVGYASVPSGGSGYDHDIAPDGVNATIAYLSPDGTLLRALIGLDQPRVAIPHPETPTIPIPPIEPPVTPPIEPPVEPPTRPERDDMTHADVRRYAAEILDTPLFGAYQRFHDEVLPRDRPMDGAIKSAAWTTGDPDFWTGDVTTGGGQAYFVRAFMPEYLIARDNGRTAEQAIGDGYDKAIAAYNKAVGVTPPTPPPGAFQGPVSAEGRDFVVPGKAPLGTLHADLPHDLDTDTP